MFALPREESRGGGPAFDLFESLGPGQFQTR